jgi:hypothetical protein
VTNIAVANTAASAGTFTLAMGTAGANTAIGTTVAIQGNTSTFIDLKQPLATTNTITGGASATTISFHISGIAIA